MILNCLLLMYDLVIGLIGEETTLKLSLVSTIEHVESISVS